MNLKFIFVIGTLLFSIFACQSIRLCQATQLNCEDFEIRGIYVGASNDIMKKLERAKNLNINAVVIDIKDDFGDITCDLGDPKLQYESHIRDIKKLLTNLKSKGIYTIARIVTFRDRSEYINDNFTIKNRDGSIYVDKEKMSWINPYNKAVWNYITKIAEAAAKIGFDEIQFDYVRLPQYKELETTSIGDNLKSKKKIQIINEFLDFAVEKLHGLGVKVSADVFGCVIPRSLEKRSSKSSENIGQDYVAISKKTDYICPMIYPSHWPLGALKTRYPDLEPGKIVERSMEYSNKALGTEFQKARPWIQAFSASWLKKGTWKKYRISQIQEQVDALRKLNIKQFCLWNSAARYDF